MYSFDDFCAQLADSLGLTPDDVGACHTIVDGLGLDELSLAALVLTVQTLNPYFELPDQMDVSDVTLADVYHYYCVMGVGHVTGSGVLDAGADG